MSMRLTILGSGSPEPHLRRASSGYLVETCGDTILFDCGGGVFDRLLQSGRRPSDVTHLVFSHLHSDHMMDYARLVHAAWDEGAAPLKVFGPPPIAEITRKLFGVDGVFAHDLAARTELIPSQRVWLSRGGTLPRDWPAPAITEIRPGDRIEGDGWSIASCEVPHAQPVLICMGFALTSGGATFVYSGDAGPCAALESMAQGADLLLHWCYRLDGDPIDPDMAGLTPTPAEIAEMAERAGVKRLLLTHLRVQHDTDSAHRAVRQDLKTRFRGPSGIAEDLEVIEIPGAPPR